MMDSKIGELHQRNGMGASKAFLVYFSRSDERRSLTIMFDRGNFAEGID